MKLSVIILCVVTLCIPVSSQRLVSPRIGPYVVPDDVLIKIVKAEDSRDAAAVIAMLTDVNSAMRYRAALAAARIGDDAAVPGLAVLLSDEVIDVRAMAAFALGEVESSRAIDAILKILSSSTESDVVRARGVEAAGKISAANAADSRAKSLGEAIISMLDKENLRGAKQSGDVIRLAITAALRARPAGADVVVAKFLTNADARIRADAANTLSRLRAKNANAALLDVAD